MNILITGAGGQLAWELQRSAPADCHLHCLTSRELDISNARTVEQCVSELKPDAVINAAAYTAVDRAESDAEAAMAVNQGGVANLAQACARSGTYLLHISTDFVFDGRGNKPYRPTDKPNPISVYGSSKLAGERELAANMEADWCVIRTSWVYSAHGKNFVKSMLQLMKDRPTLNVVSDQIGTPTWAAGLATVCWEAVANRLEGTYHWSDAGVASWYDFASAIQMMALEKGLLQSEIPIAPIRTTEYPTPAARPVFSVLDKSETLAVLPSLSLFHWQVQLSRMLDEL
jgi:dTDP-4-dehydrorhamnose reductase